MTRFSLDANILVYAADLAAGTRHERALHILDRAVRGIAFSRSKRLRSSFHLTTRKRIVARTEAAAQLRDWTTEFPIISADSGALWAALELTIDGATCLVGRLLLHGGAPGCAILLSEDMQDGARFGRVTILDPFVGEELPEPVAELLR